MPSHRLERVNELLKRALGEIVRREIPVEEAGLVTVNDVGVAADLHSATVFIGIVGSAEQRKRGRALLEQGRKRIQGLVGKEVVLKYTPQLRFVLDDAVARGERVLGIIEELERTAPPEPEVEP
jgi:ribosome-binding factor A